MIFEDRESSKPVTGSTFVWDADRALLREGKFELKEWVMKRLEFIVCCAAEGYTTPYTVQVLIKQASFSTSQQPSLCSEPQVAWMKPWPATPIKIAIQSAFK